MSEKVFLNDQLVDAESAQISIHDVGLLHGIGLFETMRAYGGKVFRLADHLDRLFDSAKALQIHISQQRKTIIGAIEDLLIANNLSDARLRLTVTPGSLRNVNDDGTIPQSTLIITAAQMVAYPPEMYEKGMTVLISDYKQHGKDATAGHKTLNYFPRMAALQEAHQNQTGEAIWFTVTNRLAEGSISNIFLVKDNILITPPLDTPVLPGIARKVVLELARENGIEATESECIVKDLLGADEVLLTNSIMEVMPVCRVEKHAVGDEKPGPVFKKISELYRAKTQEI